MHSQFYSLSLRPPSSLSPTTHPEFDPQKANSEEQTGLQRWGLRVVLPGRALALVVSVA